MALIKTKSNSIDRGRLKASLMASFLLSLTLFFFGPVNIYYTNIREMPFSFWNIWYYILIMALTVGFILFLLLWWLKGSFHITASTLVFALGLSFWVQGNILVWDYGSFDGHEIIYENYFWNGVIDLLTWISIIIVMLLYSKKLYQHIAIFSSVLLISQAGGLAATAYSAPEESEWKDLQCSTDHAKMYEFSENMNVIIIVLDSFQSNIFQEIIDENPQYRKMFDGFIYYQNNIGGFSLTEPSIIYILSGRFYNNSMPFSQFNKNTSLHSSLPFYLKKNEVRVDIKPWELDSIFPSSDIYDTIDGFSWKTDKGDSALAQYILETTRIYRLTFFRFVPQVVKQHFYHTAYIMQECYNNPNFYSNFNYCSNFNYPIDVSTPEAIFKLFHLKGTHFPYVINENLSYTDLPQNTEGYKSQAKASLKISNVLLESLRRKNIYNKSLIFIIGDHGSGSLTDLVARGTPLMLVKPFYSTGSLAISDSPVSLGDIPKTIANELKINNTLPGSSIFSINETDSRIRIFYFYNPLLEEDYRSGYYFPLRELQVSGFSWNASSWEPTYREYTSEGLRYARPPIYTPNSIIHFGIGGNAAQYLTWGWSLPEKGFRWTDGHTSIFTCSLSKPKTDLLLNVTFTPYLEAGMKSQNLSIWVNKNRLQDLCLTSDMQELNVVIPRNYFQEEIQKITFDLPDAISPSELSNSADSRTLGICVRTLSINDPLSRLHNFCTQLDYCALNRHY